MCFLASNVIKPQFCIAAGLKILKLITLYILQVIFTTCIKLYLYKLYYADKLVVKFNKTIYFLITDSLKENV